MNKTINEPIHYVSWCLAIAACYFVIGKSMLAISSSHVALVWPSAGLALGALLVKGWKYWPAILLGAQLSNLNLPFGAALFIGVGSTLAALFGWFLLIKVKHFSMATGNFRELAAFVLYGCIISPIISALIGNISLLSYGFLDVNYFIDSFFKWWFGDAMGLLILGSMIIMIVSPYQGDN
ncbi:MASE1 domain-containing protein [Thalassotalea sp. ND16A]|uniref:MASE1 domain-containing protein n=1 Tax=Thalassotalea sp. ND16A TaxID=1535422 RepID=UPI00051CE00C|nr:MASE1 domain-containing protein [Thalassotalea sp. ND16A]KGJ98459.1 putative integral membrane sensor protein [Thalassotalea sp. ND16A]